MQQENRNSEKADTLEPAEARPDNRRGLAKWSFPAEGGRGHKEGSGRQWRGPEPPLGQGIQPGDPASWTTKKSSNERVSYLNEHS